MDIRQIKQYKHELDREIQRLIQRFEHETETSVKAVELGVVQVMGEWRTRIVRVNTDVRIEEVNGK
jgi:hypothetical protein